jgi:hypothetical protein
LFEPGASAPGDACANVVWSDLVWSFIGNAPSLIDRIPSTTPWRLLSPSIPNEQRAARDGYILGGIRVKDGEELLCVVSERGLGYFFLFRMTAPGGYGYSHRLLLIQAGDCLVCRSMRY